MKNLITIVFVCFQSVVAFSQNVVTIENISDIKWITHQLSVLPQNDPNLTIDDVVKLDPMFEEHSSNAISLGGTHNSVVWLRFSLYNKSDSRIYLEVSPPTVEEVHLYSTSDEGLSERQVMGRNFYRPESAIKLNRLTMRVPIPKNQLKTFYLKISGELPSGFTFRVGTQEAFFISVHQEDLFFGWFVGIVMAIGLINLLLYPAQKDKMYLWYGLYLLSLLALSVFYYGLTYDLFLSENPLNLKHSYVLAALPGTFMALFNLSYLASNNIKNWLYKAHRYSFYFHAACSIFLILTRLPLGVVLVYVTSVPAIFMSVLSGVYSLRKGNMSAWFFICGWFAYGLSIVVYMFNNMGISIQSTPVFYDVFAGILIEGAFLTLALVYKIREMRQQQEYNNAFIINTLKQNQGLIKEQNQFLEQKVNERTQALQNALQREKDREDKLKEYAIKLEKSNRELTEFAQIVSHDLKAPLRNIASFTQLLMKRNQAKFDERDQEYMEYVLTSVKQSTRLIEDLLNYSKIDKNIGEPLPIPLSDVIKLVEFNLSSFIVEKRAEILVMELPTLLGNQSILAQLFQNLVNNGLKYNENPQPKVEISCEQRGSRLVYLVKDNGIGIAPQYQNEVFRMFRRLHTSDKYEGTGIGLSLCKRIVETYGGEIWFESIEGQGTTFFFTLPLATPVETAAQHTDNQSDNASAQAA